ncbi:hypothetical protein J4E90_006909 [Alternaria incomplexa]|uniref:uncharacterized protein n=1 Tax=Alternaria incomplexa TaxID=1187928 RepID=UPI00221FB4E3|nr:uncharacterized protein J4E90_006909 [Alternaria incomplexa]KAI4910654.1 hypothetical protein J4E90_006909 [Alternaria incomplexa]
MNWSSGNKTTQLIIVTSITLLSPIGSTINAAATLNILKQFNSTNQTVGTLVTNIFLLGYTFRPLVIAPLSELYVSDSLASLVAYRFLAGAMGSCPVTLGTGSIADMVATEKRAGAMGAYIIGAVLGPAIGPVIGGYLAPAAGWRWTFWIMAIACGVMTLVSILFVRESYPYVLLERSAQRLRKETGNLRLRSALDTEKTPRSLFVFSITRPLKLLLSPIVFLLSLYAAIVYSYLYLCFTAFEIVFYGQYSFSSGEAGLATLGIGIGSVLRCVICGVAANAVSKILTAKHGGDPKPEYRLPPMIPGGLCTPIGLFWYGWSAQARVHWIVPIVGTVFIGMGMVFNYVRLPSGIPTTFQHPDD